MVIAAASAALPYLLGILIWSRSGQSSDAGASPVESLMVGLEGLLDHTHRIRPEISSRGAYRPHELQHLPVRLGPVAALDERPGPSRYQRSRLPGDADSLEDGPVGQFTFPAGRVMIRQRRHGIDDHAHHVTAYPLRLAPLGLETSQWDFPGQHQHLGRQRITGPVGPTRERRLEPLLIIRD